VAAAWLSAASYYADLDPVHFQVPAAAGLAEGWDEALGEASDDSRANLLRLVAEAEADGQVIGWLSAHIERPHPNAAAQLTREPGWTRLVVDALIVGREHWRRGAGKALLESAEAWGREQGAKVVRLDTYAGSPVSVPFYEERMGYQRRSITFQKTL